VHNKDKFIKFIMMGNNLIDMATKGDLDMFKRVFVAADDKEILFWHITKSFKAAVKAKQLLLIEFMIEDLDLPLGDQEAFQGMLHMFIYQC
jgi:hypothetical protein